MFGKKIDKLAERLFGFEGRNCLNLYDGEGVLGNICKTNRRLRERLFGTNGMHCLNLYDGEGLIGKMNLEIKNLRIDVEELKANISKKKKTTKKK